MAIEVTVTAEVKLTQTETNESEEGGDTVYIEDTARTTVTRTMHVQYPDGYANLGWARQDSGHFDPEFAVGYASIISPEDLGYDKWSIDGFESVDIQVGGSAEDWMVQAYHQEGLVEGRSLMEKLEWFADWDNTNSSAIQKALNMVQELDNADKGTAEMTVDEYVEFTNSLSSITNGHVPPTTRNQLNQDYFADPDPA